MLQNFKISKSKLKNYVKIYFLTLIFNFEKNKFKNVNFKMIKSKLVD